MGVQAQDSQWLGGREVNSAISLRTCYAMPSTDPAYGGAVCYAMSGTDTAYGVEAKGASVE
eukprot:39269-Rhodomonas_salina.1